MKSILWKETLSCTSTVPALPPKIAQSPFHLFLLKPSGLLQVALVLFQTPLPPRILPSAIVRLPSQNGAAFGFCTPTPPPSGPPPPSSPLLAILLVSSLLAILLVSSLLAILLVSSLLAILLVSSLLAILLVSSLLAILLV